MILRLYDQVEYEWRILVDGVNIKEWVPSKLRRQIMLVEQNPLLFNMSVTDNITLGVPGFTKEQVEHAAQVAQAHEFITKLPKGYDTFVGNGGEEISKFSFTILSNNKYSDGLTVQITDMIIQQVECCLEEKENVFPSHVCCCSIRVCFSLMSSHLIWMPKQRRLSVKL
jgi:hypothetical protein